MHDGQSPGKSGAFCADVLGQGFAAEGWNGEETDVFTVKMAAASYPQHPPSGYLFTAIGNDHMRLMQSALILLLSCLPLLAQAQSKLDQSKFYRFERQDLVSPDGQRHYRLDIATPKRAAPAAGYPVIYMLDGNAVLSTLREKWLAELDAANPPVLVMIGYEIDDDYDMPQRTRDYTGVGTGDFLQLIQAQIKPLIEQQNTIDRGNQTLWGHSFGGLFVVDALLAQPQAFQNWIAASPSLWFQPDAFATGKAFKGVDDGSMRLVLMMRGSKEGKPPIAAFDDGSAERRKAMSAVPADAVRQLAHALNKLPGMKVSYQEFPGLNHGEVFAASLHPALRVAAGLPEK